MRKISSFSQGIKAAVPIGLGYFAVSFSLGIAAKNEGLNIFQGFLLSFLGNASAGEYAVLRACLKSSNEDGNEGKRENLSRNIKFPR